MKKCKHLNLNTRFLRTKKYNDEVLVEYTYCEKCNEIFKGTVSFVVLPKQEEEKIIASSGSVFADLGLPEPKETVFVKKSKPKIKKVVGVPNDKPRTKREVVQAPDGINLGDILKAKYDVKEIPVQEKKTTKKNTQSKSKHRFTPVDADALEDNEDIDIFLK